MKLTDKQNAAVTHELKSHRVPIEQLEGLTTFNEFDYWWSMLFGYRNSLRKFLINLEEK